MRPLVARIDVAALAHNLGVARAAAGDARVMAVIKANGYGHGLTRTARALRSADGFAVLSIDEAAAHPHNRSRGIFRVSADGAVTASAAPRFEALPGDG